MFGSDPVLVQRRTAQLVQDLGWEQTFKYEKFDFETVGIDPVLRVISNQNLFYPRQVTVLDFCTFLVSKKDQLPVVIQRKLLEAVRNCPAVVCLILVFRTTKTISKQLLTPFTSRGAQVVVVPPLSLSQLMLDLRQLAAQLGSKIAPAALQKLLKKAPAENYSFLFHTVHKLALITSDITPAVVTRNVTPCLQFNAFRLAQQLLANQPVAFMERLQTTQQSCLDINLLLGAISYKINEVHHQTLTRGDNDYRLTRQQLEWLIDQLFTIDHDLKTHVLYDKMRLYCCIIGLFAVWNI